jgi:hypothetical protein
VAAGTRILLPVGVGVTGDGPSATLGLMNASPAGRNLFRRRWTELLPDQPYRKTCPAHPGGT